MTIDQYEKERIARLRFMSTWNSLLVSIASVGIAVTVGTLSDSSTIGWLVFWSITIIDAGASYAVAAWRLYK